MRARRAVAALALALAAAAVAGCATVPAESPVQVVRRVTGGEDGAPPAGPAAGIDFLSVVREFVQRSASSTDRHAAARQYLLDPQSDWDDAASVTVLESSSESSFDTVPLGPDPDTGGERVRIRGVALGRLSSSGAFEPDQRRIETEVVVQRSPAGQWRIAELDPGVLVPLDEFELQYRSVRSWFVDPARQVVVADRRYIPLYPQAAQASRVLDALLAGPSTSLLGAATSTLQQARPRSNVGVGETGELVVDLTEVGELDPAGRGLLAAQVVLALDEVGVRRVRLTVDGVALLPDRPVLGRDDVAALTAGSEPGADVPALVAAGGRLQQLSPGAGTSELTGPAGNGAYDVESGASTADGQRLAVVARAGGARFLLLGGGADGGVAEVGLSAGTMTRPTWTPTGAEVWTVLNGATVARVSTGGAGAPVDGQVNAEELVAFGPIEDLRLSRDGVRVAAVVGGGLYTGAVTRSIDGEVAIRGVRRLRSLDLTEVTSADWRSGDTIVVTTARTGRGVAEVSVDGLQLTLRPVTNLTSPLGAVAAAPNRPLLVTDASGVWSFGGGQQDAWRQVLGGAQDAVAAYPG